MDVVRARLRIRSTEQVDARLMAAGDRIIQWRAPPAIERAEDGVPVGAARNAVHEHSQRLFVALGCCQVQ